MKILEEIKEGKFTAFKVESDGFLYIVKPELSQSRGGFRKINPNTHHYREVAAYLLDSKILKFNIVPKTILINFNGKPASAQDFVSGAMARDIVPGLFQVEDKEYFTKIGNFTNGTNKGNLVKLILFDLIVNNTDRHIRNCLFDEYRVWAIDNGCCFGQYYTYYYNVFHRFLYSDTLILTDYQRKLLNSIEKKQLYKIIGPYLEEEEVEQTYYRIQWILEQKNLCFKLMSGNQEDRRFYPSKSKWFKQRMSSC